MSNALPLPQSNWQSGFLALLPAVQSHVRFAFGTLHTADRQEALQEATAASFISYQALAAKGRLHEAHPSTLARFGVRHVRQGRHVGGRQDSAKDVMSALARCRHGVTLQSYDQPEESRGDGWRSMAVPDRKAADVAGLVAFRIDFAQWLGEATERDRRIIAALISGEATGAVAERFGLTPGRVSQLRRVYERRWRAFQGEDAAAA